MYEEIIDSDLVMDPNGGNVTISNPVVGTYTVTMSGNAIGEVFITIGYMDETTSGEQQITLYCAGNARSFTFIFDPSTETKITDLSLPMKPGDLKAFENAEHMTALNWAPVSETLLSGYRIYTRRYDEPFFELLASVPAETTNYQTGQPWYDPLRIYAISAITSDGREGSLSAYVRNETLLIAGFTAFPLTGGYPLSVNFTDTSSGTPVSWLWDFGDGNTNTGQNPIHIYSSPGTYSVSLKVEGVEGTDLAIKFDYIAVSESTLIKLSSFTTTAFNKKIIIKWTTASEIDNAGFNLYRSESEGGEYVKINPTLIPAEGSPTQGASYEYVDTGVKNRTIYYYKLEDIDLNGKTTMHGPVSAEPHRVRSAE
jgi:PKD repeat protein